MYRIAGNFREIEKYNFHRENFHRLLTFAAPMDTIRKLLPTATKPWNSWKFPTITVPSGPLHHWGVNMSSTLYIASMCMCQSSLESNGRLLYCLKCAWRHYSMKTHLHCRCQSLITARCSKNNNNNNNKRKCREVLGYLSLHKDHYRRTSFSCENLIIVNCEFF